MLGLDIKGGVAICAKEKYGDWFRDPWSWFEIAWAGENTDSLQETDLLSKRRSRISLAVSSHFTPIEIPKTSLATRPAVIIDPLSRLLYAAALAPSLKQLHADLPKWCLGWRYSRKDTGSFEDNGLEWNRYARILTEAKAAGEWALEADISSFFASIDLGRVEEMVGRSLGKTGPSQVLIEVARQHDGLAGRSGLPQRSFVSAAIANSFMRPVDDVLEQYFKEANDNFAIRWMDDFNAVGDHSRLYRLHLQIEARAHQIGLELNSSKSKLRPIEEFRDEFRDTPLETIRFIFAPGDYRDGSTTIKTEVDASALERVEEELLDDLNGQSMTLVKKVLNALRKLDRFGHVDDWMQNAKLLPHVADTLGRYLRGFAQTSPDAGEQVDDWVAEEFLPSDWATVDWVGAQMSLAVPREAVSESYCAILRSWLSASTDPQKIAVAAVRLASLDNAACRDLLRARFSSTDNPVLLRLFALSLLEAGDGRSDVLPIVRRAPQNKLLELALTARNWSPPSIAKDFDPSDPSAADAK